MKPISNQVANMKIAVVGAGPSGSMCASLLARGGAGVLLLDPKGAWEKPCGGGVTRKALSRFPFLEACLDRRRQIRSINVVSPSDARVSVALDQPLAIYSRQDLNQLLLDRAIDAGACFLRERALDFRRKGHRWELLTNQRTY